MLFGRFHLVGRKERRVLELISDQFGLVAKAVQELEPLLEAAKGGDIVDSQSGSLGRMLP